MSQDKELTELDECTAVATGDLLYVVDVSDTSGSAEGTSKYAQAVNAIGKVLYPITSAETSAGVTPTDYTKEPGNVLRYGAVGDGVTDDYAAIMRAVSVSDQAYFGVDSYIVFFPNISGTNGRYMVSQTITLDRNGIAWHGEMNNKRQKPVEIAFLV